MIRVQDVDGLVPVPGATITVGSGSAISALDGTFTLPNVARGSATVRVTAAGFDPATQVVTVGAAGAFVEVALWPANSMHEAGGFLLYIPSGVAVVRGVFFFMQGGGADSRPFVSNDLAFFEGTPASITQLRDYRRRLLTVARAHGLALIGSLTDPAAAAPSNILQALHAIAGPSGHPELANVPLMVHGNSASACASYNFPSAHPERTIGFIIGKATSCTLHASPSIAVPGYLIYGEHDTVLPDAGSQMTDLFERNRANGAVWALAVEAGVGHDLVSDHDLVFNWITEVINRRLPPATTPGMPVELRPLDETSGWLGDRGSRAIAEYACYAGNERSASWLPSEQTARDWQAMVSLRSITTVTACAP